MPTLSLRDLAQNDPATVAKVRKVIKFTNSKRELAKAMAYGAAWGSGLGDELDGYLIYNEACNRAKATGDTNLHTLTDTCRRVGKGDYDNQINRNRRHHKEPPNLLAQTGKYRGD